MNIQCEMCGKVKSEKSINHLHLEEQENGECGSYIYFANICSGCSKELLNQFKVKIDISKSWKKDYTQSKSKTNKSLSSNK